MPLLMMVGVCVVVGLVVVVVVVGMLTWQQ